MKFKGYTVNTFRELRNKYPSPFIYFCIVGQSTTPEIQAGQYINLYIFVAMCRKRACRPGVCTLHVTQILTTVFILNSGLHHRWSALFEVMCYH